MKEFSMKARWFFYVGLLLIGLGIGHLCYLAMRPKRISPPVFLDYLNLPPDVTIEIPDYCMEPLTMISPFDEMPELQIGIRTQGVVCAEHEESWLCIHLVLPEILYDDGACLHISDWKEYGGPE